MFGLIAAACSGRTDDNHAQAGGGASGAAAAGGETSQAMAGSGAPAAGSGHAGAASAGAANASNAGSSNVGEGGQTDVAGAAGENAGGAAPSDVFEVKPSLGCGKEPLQDTGVFVKHTLQTSGTKAPNCADAQCGAWSYLRDYYVWLPKLYEKARAYPLVLEGPGCTGTGLSVYSLSSTNTEVGAGLNGSVIRVGLTPPPNEIGHATSPNQGCFDDREGDDSVDVVFYETLIDKLKDELCYDENRVFVAGYSSGAWLANELGCKYAGNTGGYAIRGVLSARGYLPTEAAFRPTCSDKPMAGTWVVDLGEPVAPVNQWHVAINRAMTVNGCSESDYELAQHAAYPIGGGRPDSTCQKVVGCPTDYPLVVCPLPGVTKTNLDEIANPAFATFLQSLEAP